MSSHPNQGGGGGGGGEPLDTTYFDQLPPEPEGECPVELQQRVIDFLARFPTTDAAALGGAGVRGWVFGMGVGWVAGLPVD